MAAVKERPTRVTRMWVASPVGMNDNGENTIDVMASSFFSLVCSSPVVARIRRTLFWLNACSIREVCHSSLGLAPLNGH